MTCPDTDETRPKNGTASPNCPYVQQRRTIGLRLVLAIAVLVLAIALLIDLRPAVCPAIALTMPDAVEAAPSQGSPSDAGGIKFWPENE